MIDNSVINCDEIMETTKIIPASLYISLTFLLIIIALLIAVSSYCYLIKYWAKQKQHLLPYHVTNNKLKKVLY